MISPEPAGPAQAPRPAYADLAGAVVVVTGAAQGIGRAIAERFAANGSRVVVADRNLEGAEEVVSAIAAAGGSALASGTDVTDEDQIAAMLTRVTAALGVPDVLVNNVGWVLPYDPSNSILQMTRADWDQVLELNLTSTFLCTRAFAPAMIERGSGCIVNIASNIGRNMDIVTGSHYAAAKAGVLHLTRHVARELADRGVRVNAVAPGVTSTPRARAATRPETREAIVAMTPMGRIAEAEEIAGAVLFLASSDASYITGATIDVAGGRVMA